MTAAELRDRARAKRVAAEILKADARAALTEAWRLENEAHEAEMAENAKIPVDRSQRTLTDGSSVTPDHRELKENGQQKGYVVLSAEERAKGFVRPVRDTYRHLTCGSNTTMGRSIAETYARDPGFYSGTFCVGCGQHFPLDQFVWDDGTRVGS